MRFHFMKYSVNSIISRVSHRLLYCVLLKSTLKIENARNFHISSKQINLEHETQHAVITYANTSNGIKISTFLEKSWGMMLYLYSVPLIPFLTK